MFSYVTLEQRVPQDDDGANFHGQPRSNDTHQSTTDPDARLYKKSYGKESKLAYLGHALVENRNGLIAAAMVRVDWAFVFGCAAHNLLRLPRLLANRSSQGLQQKCA